MTSFLGVPVKVRERGLRQPLLTNKRDGAEFDEEDEGPGLGMAVAAVSPSRTLVSTRGSKRSPSSKTATALPATFTTRSSSASSRSGSHSRERRASPAAPRWWVASSERRGTDETIRQLRNAIFDSKSRSIRTACAEAHRLIEESSRSWACAQRSPSADRRLPISAAVAEHLLATLREALTNVAKHAPPAPSRLTVSVADDLLLVVADNGRGIDPEAPTTSARAENLRMRASHSGAR